jgi:hypothetical protein
VFIGHVSVALAAQRARPSVPLPALIAATFGPDVIEITLMALWRWARVQAVFGSHSIPAVLLGAAVVGGAYSIWRRDVLGGGLLMVTYASHWAADLFTGTSKPTWVGGPWLGLALYDRPVADFILEAGVLLGAWLLLWPARDRRRRPRVVQVVAPVGLVLLQLVFNTSQWLFGIRSIKALMSEHAGPGDAARSAIVPPARSTPPT